MTETVPRPERAKADPETLALRASPGRVTRFRRGAIIAVAAAASAAIAGVAWLALKPATLGLVAADEERNLLAAKAPADALAGAPASYGDVPQLGPPLPGDLGKPILDHQREMGMATLTDPAAEAAARAAQEAEMKRQRIVAEKRAARESGIILPLAGRSRAASAPADDAPAQERSPAEGRRAPDPDPSGQQRRDEPVGGANRDDRINPHVLVQPVSPWTLHAGSVIAASLITGLNSDLPGFVTAQITENVYDSATGRAVLIPQGSRLIGIYDSVVAFGQSRALVVWQRIILPDGSSIRIDNVPATDTQGHAGLSDRVDRHTWQLLKGVMLSTLLGVGSELSFGGTESDLVAAVRESTQRSAGSAGDQLVRHNLDVQPTLKVRPGWPLRVILHRDLVLPGPWKDNHG